jgi:AAA domain
MSVGLALFLIFLIGFFFFVPAFRRFVLVLVGIAAIGLAGFFVAAFVFGFGPWEQTKDEITLLIPIRELHLKDVTLKRHDTAAGSTLILAAEDDVCDTLSPRLHAVGADMSRIFTIRSVRDDNLARRTFNLQADLVRLETEIEKRGDVRLVVIDPVSSYLGRVDSHRNAEVRAVLEPLGEMAARMRVAVICNNHFSKNGGNANSRIIGSVAFVNQARAAFIVTPDAEHEGRMLLMPSKMNIAPMRHGLAYRIESCWINGDDGEILTSRIAWESAPVTISADEALAALAGGDEAKTAKAEAMDFLSCVLGPGPKTAGAIQQEARGAGITAKSLRSAREAMGIKPTKTGFDGGWVWSLPKMPNMPEGAHVSERASWGPEGHLGPDRKEVLE